MKLGYSFSSISSIVKSSGNKLPSASKSLTVSFYSSGLLFSSTTSS